MKKIGKFLMMFALLSFVFTSCNDDDNDDPIDVSKDGAYVAGAAVGSIDVKFDQALVEGASFSSYERTGMHEVYFYCVAGALEFKVIKDGAATVYGPENVNDVTLDGSDSQIIGTFKTGTLAAGKTPINIETEGFYHLIYDETSMNFWVIPVLKWEWVYDDTELETGAASAEKVEWTKTDVKFSTHQSKLRYNDGWKIITDVPILPEHAELTDGDFVVIFTNLGFNDQDALEPGAGNGDVEKGVYTITLTWTPAQKFVIDLNKTSDVENTDYSEYLLGFIGNGIMVSDTAWGWGDLSYENQTPTKDGEIYTWTWNSVKVAANGDQENSWKFRKDNAWDFTLGFNDVTMSGSAAGDFFAGSGDGNFGVAEEGEYDFVLTVNADNDSWTLGATK